MTNPEYSTTEEGNLSVTFQAREYFWDCVILIPEFEILHIFQSSDELNWNLVEFYSLDMETQLNLLKLSRTLKNKWNGKA